MPREQFVEAQITRFLLRQHGGQNVNRKVIAHLIETRTLVELFLVCMIIALLFWM